MKKLLDTLEKKMVLKAKEALELGVNRMTLSRMSELGEIQMLGGGFYAHKNLDFILAGALTAAKYYPNAVISRQTALRIYDLAPEKIYKIDIDIPYTQSIRNELFETHRVSKKHMTDIVEYKYEGHKIRIYSKMRTLYEAHKLYGYDLEFYRVIKKFITTYKDEVESKKIEKLDKLFKLNIASLLAQEVTDDFF
ncbi:MAG: type IV toxin-antitoxin system AbiEi family antitoxin domain-containing protein [Bacteriovoracaceae bacterium]